MSNFERNRKARDAKLIKYAEISREVNYGKFNIKRAEKKWKQICLNVTLPKLRGEIVSFWHYFEKIIDAKDFMISLHMDEIRQHQEIYEMNLKKHQYNMEKFMEGLSQKMREIHSENNEFLMFLIKKSLDAWDDQNYKENISQTHLKVIRFGLEVLKKRWNKMAMTDYFANRNDASSKHIHEIQEISFVLELRLEGLWDHIRISEEEYWQRTRENRAHHESIQKNLDATNNIVKKELDRLMNLQVLAKRLASKFEELVSTMGKKLEYLEREKESVHKLQLALRNKLMQDMNNDKHKRRMMSTEFATTFDHLKSKVKIGENVIKILNGTRKYKTKREKILPYPHNSCDLEENQLYSIPQLRLFWQKVAEAGVYRYTLNEERTYLKAENKNLRKQIHSYCKCLQCPSLPQVPLRTGKIPYTEGREMMQKHKTQNRRYNSVPEDISR